MRYEYDGGAQAFACEPPEPCLSLNWAHAMSFDLNLEQRMSHRGATRRVSKGFRFDGMEVG
jgi:hypothetical protein